MNEIQILSSHQGQDTSNFNQCLAHGFHNFFKKYIEIKLKLFNMEFQNEVRKRRYFIENKTLKRKLKNISINSQHHLQNTRERQF